MLKITIANEEVLCSNDFTINKEMLNTPSVILNNVYPKTWELNKDYTTNFYYPNDYEQCLITDETYYPYEEGITVEGTSFTLTDVDSTKESELMSVKGQTTQNGTPTPTTPIPINVVSGRQDVNVVGKNWLSITGNSQTINGITFTVNEDGSIRAKGLASANATFTSTTLQPILPNIRYRLSGCPSGGSTSTYRLLLRVRSDLTTNLSTIGNVGNGAESDGRFTTQSNANYILGEIIIYSGQDVDLLFKPQVEIIDTSTTPATSYEAYTGNTYEINLGKNLLINTATSQTINGITYTVNEDKSVTANGTATAHSVLNLYGNLTLQAGTYMFSGCPSGGSWGTYSMGFGSYNDSGNGATFTKTENYVGQPYIRIGNGTTVNNLTFKPMIEKGNTKTTYAPYKTPIELCKIGTYQDRIYKTSGKNLFDKDNANILNAWFGPSQTTIQSNDLNRMLYIPCEPNTTYTFSKIKSYTFTIGYTTVLPNASVQVSGIIANANATSLTITTGSDAEYLVLRFYHTNLDTLTYQQVLDSIQIEKGNQESPYEPYGSGTWYLTKYVGKVVLNGSEGYNYESGNLRFSTVINNSRTEYTRNPIYSNYFKYASSGGGNGIAFNYGGVVYLYNYDCTSVPQLQTWLSTHNTSIYYILATPTTTEITDTELISQLESIELLNGLNNISVSTPYLPFIMTLRYNHQEEHTDSDLIFCGVVKNSGQISLNPRQPHYSTLQILDYKTFLSEGELDTFVISNKTVLEAIQMIISDISQYGFELGTVSIQNENDIIGAYSTKDKSAYDVFNYIADITQSRWTTRVLDKGRIAIDFYDPSLMEQGTTIDYTQTWFKNNNIIDMSFNYGTWDYRNKQVMTSQEVYGSITQNQIINYDGYATQIMTEFPIGQINAIYVNGVGRLFSTNEEKSIGLTADFYYSPGDNFFERNMSIGAGSQIIISYIPIVEGRQIVTNASEISRVATASGVKGIVSRYENRNDATTSDELQKIGQSYIKYKGEPEITLTVKTESNLWEIGQRVQFNAPIEELDTEYMVKKKAINYVVTANKIFYTYELSSSFNSESAINYFDNQRAKANGNIKKGQYVSRNVDLEEEAQIIFYDTTATTTSITGNNVLQSSLETILGG